MKISEARQLYSTQIKAYHEQQVILSKQKKDLEGKIEGYERIVLHTGKGYLTKEAAQYLVEAGVKTVVTDYWSIAPLDNEKEIHEIILGNGVAAVESVVLDGVEDGEYILSAFPIKIEGCDGGFVRAVLIKEK